MSKKIKIDKYSVYGKKRRYDILVFPEDKYMWAYDPHPGEPFYMIDGDPKAIRNLAIAMAILATDPSKIIYFPIKKDISREHFWDSTHLVLMRPELQFRRSEWFRLKGKLDKRHWTGKYAFSYNPQKLNDYYKKIKSSWNYPDWEKRDYSLSKDEIRGDVMFMVLPRNACYFYHFSLDESFEYYAADDDFQYCWAIGHLMRESFLKEKEEDWEKKSDEEISKYII